jgi:hypothetical protein
MVYLYLLQYVEKNDGINVENNVVSSSVIQGRLRVVLGINIPIWVFIRINLDMGLTFI